MQMASLQNNELRLEQVLPLLQDELAAGRSVRFSPRGVSMLPMLVQGRDSVLLSPVPDKLKKYDLPLYRRKDGQFVLHRIVEAGETYTCVGDNQFKLETGLMHDQMIAVVTEFTRNGKTYSVDARAYRLYCAGWHYTRPVRGLWRRGIKWLRRQAGRAKRWIKA